MEVESNLHFSNVVKNLKIPEKFVTDSLPQSLSRHPTLNAMLKCRNHPSMQVNIFSTFLKFLFFTC